MNIKKYLKQRRIETKSTISDYVEMENEDEVNTHIGILSFIDELLDFLKNND